MEQNKKLKLFISYSHHDEKSYIDQFKKHIHTLKDNGLIEDWYDREILAGEDFQNKINNNLEDADIICLFISKEFLSSPSCKKEKEKALELRKKKGISVIPIILSSCEWLDEEDISKLLALPADGKPISKFEDPDEAWLGVYEGLKKIIEKEIKFKNLKITEEFESFLQDTEMLTNAHSEKERVLLDDIFMPPDLDKFNDLGEHEEISSEELFKKLLDYPRIVIAGENQSGKTSLCKVMFKELRKRNFVPVYISDEKDQFRGRIENKILESFHKQYDDDGFDINEIDKERIIPIIDDFHFAKNKEKHVKDLSVYPRCILIVDDIFSLNIEDEKLLASFTRFKISEFKPTLRNELIKKWRRLTDKEIRDIDYRDIDRTTELIDSTLGETIGKKIMPAYPFFILSAIVTYETLAIPLNQEITSQGYCYEAFIYFYLRKQGVRNDEIDTYMNFLTELAFYFYKEKKYELFPDDFTSFMKLYLEKYNLPIDQKILLKNLSLIVSTDSFNNYSFRYPYLYYFFVAKYLADHLENEGIKEEIEKIMNNLHVNENAYIAVFMSHHSKNIGILCTVERNVRGLFDKYEPATLIKDEVKFFDEQVDKIIEPSLPSVDTTPETERKKRLRTQDKLELSQNAEEQENSDKEDSLGRDLRRAIKTVEVMGTIIKNRAGSLEKTKLEEIFLDGMNLHLRILSSFFDLIKDKEGQEAIIDFISVRLKKIIKESDEKKKELNREDLKKMARMIFWNLNFFIVYGFINKIVHSLGSDKLIKVEEEVCDEVGTPVSFLVKHGILMWYNKNLQVNELAVRIKEKDFSKLAERVSKLMVVDYCSLHPIDYKDRQRIENKLRISTKKLLTRGYKGS
ncbi:TIR domain-containing protein [Petrotoga sibirica]|uniref:TIR domain-containing protein n=2 Tax=Petrotoga sibirica TaxID=156202 RepID=A0A4R8ED76_9BACT|nr:TIR domain-containing protein [Petrotoga sibirica]POZ88365.1 toll-Interleukin receptor [Petrotoga sibirica DSM 13575]TDX09632.1 TIR domain-containing protein [Petrotoga sibirica]